VSGAVIVPLVVAVDDEDLHRSHFFVRAHETRARPQERYLSHFPNIRKIQKYVRSLALKNGVAIIQNYNLDATLAAVIDHVVARATETAAARPLPPAKRLRRKAAAVASRVNEGAR
jgi:2-phosphoglycerate kinase